MLLLLIVGTALVLAALLTALAIFVQPYLYSEAVAGVAWRGPTAGAAIAVVVALWLVLARGAPDGRYQTLLEFAGRDKATTFEELVLTDPEGNKVVYLRKAGSTGKEAFTRNGRPGRENVWPSRPLVFWVKEGGQEIEFKAELDARGKFKPREDGVLYYRDAKNREMSEGYPGEISNFRWGALGVNLLLNLVFFVVMLLALWLLLEYQFWHAFGLAIVLWAVMILFVLPPMIDYAQKLGGA